MTSLSQSELNGAETEPFRVDLDDLLKRERQSKSVDTKGIFERIYQGSMPAIASGKNSNSQIFIAAICLPISSAMSKSFRMRLML